MVHNKVQIDSTIVVSKHVIVNMLKEYRVYIKLSIQRLIHKLPHLTRRMSNCAVDLSDSLDLQQSKQNAYYVSRHYDSFIMLILHDICVFYTRDDYIFCSSPLLSNPDYAHVYGQTHIIWRWRFYSRCISTEMQSFWRYSLEIPKSVLPAEPKICAKF